MQMIMNHSLAFEILEIENYETNKNNRQMLDLEYLKKKFHKMALKNHPDKKIKLLGKPICMCSMMDRTSPEHLCWNLESLVKGETVNQVSVDPSIIEWSNVALDRMFQITALRDDPNKFKGK
jgi:quinolinate synthase